MERLNPEKTGTVRTDYKICFVCQKTSTREATVTPTLPSLEKVLTCTRDLCRYGCRDHIHLLERLANESADTLFHKEPVYHKTCYTNIVHPKTIESAKRRYEIAITEGNASAAVFKKRGRPSHSELPSTPSEKKIKRNTCATFDKCVCVFCQTCRQDDGIHSVATTNMGLIIMNIVDNTHDSALRVRMGGLLNEPGDAIALDLKYHLPCLVKYQRDCKTVHTSDKSELGSGCKVEMVIADIELIHVVECALSDCSGSVLNMNDINTTYVNLLEEHNVRMIPSQNYKKHLKALISDNIPFTEFMKPARKNESERLCSTKTKDDFLDRSFNETNDSDEIKVLLQASTILRHDIATGNKWTFQGTFDDFAVPQKLYSFMKWVIEGPCSKLHCDRRRTGICQSASNIAQHLMTSYISDRQVNYTPTFSTGKFGYFRRRAETPLSIGSAIMIHQQTRKKSLIQALANMNITQSYKRTLRLENRIANAVAARMQETEGLFIPSFTKKGQSIYFAIDNIDFLEDTPTGKDTLHGTAIAMFQNENLTGEHAVPSLELDTRLGHVSYRSTHVNLLQCSAPKLDSKAHSNYILQGSREICNTYRLYDMAWMIGCCGKQSLMPDDSTQEETNVVDSTVQMTTTNTDTCVGMPKWAAYNSLLTESRTITNATIVPPILRTPPTSWTCLYTALKRAQHISVLVMGENRPAVITLDMQLYEKAQKLVMSRADLKGKFVLRIGELHTVFSALKTVGRYIEGSGIDQLWVDVGMYSPATVRKIIDGKHLYRAMEAHMVTIIALYSIFFHTVWKQDCACIEAIDSATSKLNHEFQDWKGNNMLSEAHRTMVATLERHDLIGKLDEFDQKTSGMSLFIRNYMRQFECILRHVRATRQGLWHLHLAAQEELCTYFFAHDHLSYARLSPLYCAEMRALESDDPDTWNALEAGDFCVTKSEIPFCSIGPDHGIEHENRSMKVLGGIVGLTQNESALDKFFLVAPELSRLVKEFMSMNSINVTDKRKYHHELTGGAKARTFKNVEDMKTEILVRGNPFMEVDEVQNIMTKAVMPDDIKQDVTKRDAIGTSLVNKFVTERIKTEHTSIWSPMKKRSLKLFKQNNKLTKTKVGQKVIELREERNLLARFMVISRSRPELDLKDAIGVYEFSAIPRSLFAPDGTLLIAYDKASIMHAIEDIADQTSALASECDIVEEGLPNLEHHGHSGLPAQPSVLVVDGMAVVNAINKTATMKTCREFAAAFLEKLACMAVEYGEIRLVFDRYIAGSLKEKVRDKRTGGNAVRYHVEDMTDISNVSLKQFLSHIETKAELTEYLAYKALEHYKGDMSTRLIVTWDSVTRSNMDDQTVFRCHTHEEADTLIALHCLEVSDTYIDTVLHVFSPDTDVLLLLIHWYTSLSKHTFLLTGKGQASRKISIQSVHSALGNEKAKALLGFHSFSGCDTTGKFSGKTKATCFKTFLAADPQIITAFQDIGVSNDTPTDATVNAMEKFVCQLYRPRGTTFSKLSELRWHLFSQKQAEGERLPPTLGALKPHIHRSHFVAGIWKRSNESCSIIPPATSFGWHEEHCTLVPIQNLNPPAPESILLLVKCSCQTDCSNCRCSCVSSHICCTEFCGCTDNCQNPSEETKVSDIVDLGDGTDDESEEEDCC